MVSNPNQYSKSATSPTAQIEDGVDFPHTGLIKALSLGMANTYAISGFNASSLSATAITVADGVRKIKYTLGTSTEYALFFDGDDDVVDIGAIDAKMEMQLSCNENVVGHSSEAACDAGKDNHTDLSTGHFNKIVYGIF